MGALIAFGLALILRKPNLTQRRHAEILTGEPCDRFLMAGMIFPNRGE
jgi:hypothetical protein